VKGLAFGCVLGCVLGWLYLDIVYLDGCSWMVVLGRGTRVDTLHGSLDWQSGRQARSSHWWRASEGLIGDGL
jgi:hypothetical protein